MSGEEAPGRLLERSRERRVRTVGEVAILIEADSAADVQRLNAWVQHHPLRALLIDVVPGARTLYLTGPREALRQFAAQAPHIDLAAVVPQGEPRLVTIDVRYDGLDLADVARHLQLTPAEVVQQHTATEYVVQFFGFSPGQAFFAELPPSLRAPRRATPRVRVPSGSVAIANEFTVIYPPESPGGWNLIGTRVSAPLWDSSAAPPNRVSVGDRIRFRAVP